MNKDRIVARWRWSSEAKPNSVPDWVVQAFLSHTISVVGEEGLAVTMVVGGDRCVRTIKQGDFVVLLSSGLLSTIAG